MSDEKSASDEAIGRPAEWREGRYQQPGKPADSAKKAPEKPLDVDPVPESTPVTRRDYE